MRGGYGRTEEKGRRSMDLLRGSWWLSAPRCLLSARALFAAYAISAVVHDVSPSSIDPRICHGLDSVESSIHYELDISSRQTGNALMAVSVSIATSQERKVHTSSTASGVGAPGPPPPSPKVDWVSSASPVLMTAGFLDPAVWNINLANFPARVTS